MICFSLRQEVLAIKGSGQQPFRISTFSLSYFTPVSFRSGMQFFPGLQVGTEYPLFEEKHIIETSKRTFLYHHFRLISLVTFSSYIRKDEYLSSFLNGEASMRYSGWNWGLFVHLNAGMGLQKKMLLNSEHKQKIRVNGQIWCSKHLKAL